MFNVSHANDKNISLFLRSSIHSSHLSLFGTTYELYQLYDLIIQTPGSVISKGESELLSDLALSAFC